MENNNGNHMKDNNFEICEIGKIFYVECIESLDCFKCGEKYPVKKELMEEPNSGRTTSFGDHKHELKPSYRVYSNKTSRGFTTDVVENFFKFSSHERDLVCLSIHYPKKNIKF